MAELGYLVTTRIGQAAEAAVLRELAGGAYVLPDLGVSDLQACLG